MNRFIVTTIAIVGLLGCQRVQAETRAAGAPDFGAYWNRGQAELTSYTLKQARYGELHEGQAVMIFVTEPFSKKKQVKLDNAQAAGADAVPVLKLNFTRKFNTGVYPYSMMTSVFTPVAGGPPIKITATSQEWCGHTFMQLNQTDRGYRGHLYSYFESEGDQELELATHTVEDDIWMQIRIAPDKLPIGKVMMVPGATHLRLRHLKVKPEHAVASVEDKGARRIYRIKYASIDRELTIEFNKAFPHEIEGWTESYVSGWGASAERLTTVGQRNKRIMSDYWARHGNADKHLRKELGLD